ncbi:MAG TPA: VOC family protein [Burkholderiaceae bacterium]|nr:VOC family protein [Burkholderiaceae bacterium]
MNACVDHLVVVADTLEQGTQWCEATLGVEPASGGRHPLMGTHNRLLAIGAERFPDVYLEIIAVDPDAPAPGRARWYEMDDAALRAAVRERPRLVHAVARTTKIEMLRWGLINCGLNPGTLLAVQRDTPHGRLSWRLTVRDDGRFECAGALPTLIEWQGPHPCDHLSASPVVLNELILRGVPPRVADVLKLPAVQMSERNEGDGMLRAVFDTPRGRVALDAWR